MAISQSVAQAILGQRTPDIMGAFEQGQETAFKRQERDRQEKIRELSGMAIQGNEGAMGDLSDLDASTALKIQDALGVGDKGALERMYIDAKNAMGLLAQGQPQQALALARNRLQNQSRMGVMDNSHTESVERLLAEGNIDGAMAQLSSFVSAIDSVSGGGRQGPTGAMRERDALINDLNSDDPNVRRSAEVALKLEAAPVGSADITTATTKGLSEQVGESQATIKELAKFGEMTAASRANTIDKGYESIQLIDKGLGNIDRAIQAVRDGASTGKIASKFPSIARAAVELEQIADSMALDVIGSVTLGAISEAELDLARQVALPVGLKGEDLIQHLIARKAAQIKLRGYLEEQVDFLDQGGTIPKFLRMKKAQREQATPQQENPQTPPTQQTQPQRVRFDAQGNIL